jgi:two-component system OmpR family sensor kinase
VSRLPIRIRLTLVFAIVMAVVLAALGAFLYLRLGDSLDERIAEDLDARRIALTRVVSTGARDVDPSLLAGEEGLARVIGPGASGPVLATSGNHGVLLAADELAAAHTRAVTTDHDGYRLLATPVGDDVVLVGEPLDDRTDALSALLAQLLVALPLALVASCAIGYAVAGAALRPIEAMRLHAAEISAATSAQRLPLPVAHDEVYRLGETLNQMLERLDSALERERRFVADASHELRTPLAILKAELEVALRQPRSATELEQALASAAEETDRLVRLAENLLLVARSDRGVLRVARDAIPVDELLVEVAGRFRGGAESAGRVVEVERSTSITVDGDRERLGRALGNLVDNALRHGSGTVRLHAAERDGLVELHVTDEGGFEPAFLPRAFERFTRADDARTGDGTGLGLAIVDAIARAHGGSAHAANLATGDADVWITAPRLLNEGDASGPDRGDLV